MPYASVRTTIFENIKEQLELLTLGTAYLGICFSFPQITIYLSGILGIYSDFSGIWVTGWWDRYGDESKLIWEGTETWDEQWKHSNNHGGKAGRLSSLKSEQHNITNVNFQRGMTHSLYISRLKSAQKCAPNNCSSNNNTHNRSSPKQCFNNYWFKWFT